MIADHLLNHLYDGQGLARITAIVARLEPVEAEDPIVRALLLGKQQRKSMSVGEV
jgi:hypothetical protein